MRLRIARAVAAAAGVLAGGAGLGFIARDLLGLGQPVVALAWLAGALAVLAGELGPSARRAGGKPRPEAAKRERGRGSPPPRQ